MQEGWARGAARLARPKKRWLAFATIGVVLVGVGCASKSGSGGSVEAAVPEGFAASPAFLRTVAKRTGDEPYRYETWLSLDDEPTDGDPFMTGEVDGVRSHAITNITALREEIERSEDGELPPGPAWSERPEAPEISIEWVHVGDEVMYGRLPFLLEVADSDLTQSDRTLKQQVAGTDGWFKVDFSQVTGISFDDYKKRMSGGQGQDPAQLVDLLARANDAEELGSQRIRGESMSGIGAKVTFGDILRADGTDPDFYVETMTETMVNTMPSTVPPDDAAEMRTFFETLYQTMVDSDLSAEAWVDSRGYLGRMVYTLDTAELFRAAAEAVLEDDILDESDAQDLRQELDGLDLPAVTTTLDLFDYGDSSISIEAPSAATDLTSQPELAQLPMPSGESMPAMPGFDGDMPGMDAAPFDPPGGPPPPMPEIPDFEIPPPPEVGEDYSDYEPPTIEPPPSTQPPPTAPPPTAPPPTAPPPTTEPPPSG